MSLARLQTSVRLVGALAVALTAALTAAPTAAMGSTPGSTPSSTARAAPAADPSPAAAAGKTAFAATCASCHQIGPYARANFGPQLNGVIGRRAGSTTDFKYSDAMLKRKADLVWDERTLAAFIRDPDKVVPGTKMRFFGLGYSDKKLAELMAYLRANPAQ